MLKRIVTNSLFAILIVIIALTVVCSMGSPAKAQVTGISYTITPVVEGIRFADDAALKDAALFGGKLGFGFGEFIEINGLYLFGSNIKSDFGDIFAVDIATTELLRALPSRGMDLRRYGANLKFNMGRGGVFPFLTLGTGVLRFEPDHLNESESIYISAGLGMQYSLRDRYTVVAQVSNLSYRYNFFSSFLSEDDASALGVTADDFGLTDVNNLSASIGIQVYLGGRQTGKLSELDRALQEQLRGGLRGIALRVEPTAGEIDFADVFGLRNKQRFVGLAAGIDLGPLVGLRGFYWRGTPADSWTEFDDIQAYGGEIKFAFSDIGGSLTPYLLVGGGYMDVLNGYVGSGATAPEDHPFAVGGFGAVLPLGNSVNLDGSVQSVLMSSSGVDNVSSPNNIEANTMFMLGISFGLGGSSQTAGSVFGREMAASYDDRRKLAADVTSQKEKLARAQTRIDSLATIISMQQRGLGLAGWMEPSSEAAAVRAQRLSLTGVPQATGPDSALAWQVPGATPLLHPVGEEARSRETRWVTLPLPEEGELYLRFGRPGAVSVETITGDPLTYYMDPATGKLIPVSPAAAASAATPGIPVERLQETIRQPLPAQALPAQPLAAEQQPTQSLPAQLLPAHQLPAEQASPQQATVPSGEAEVLQRLESSLDTRFKLLEDRINNMREEQEAAGRLTSSQVSIEPQAAVTPAAEVRTGSQEPTSEEGTLAAPGTRLPSKFNGVHVLTGYNASRPHQWLIGIRAEFKRANQSYRVLPEFVLGTGDGDTSINVNLNGIYDLGIGIVERAYPYAGLGIGLLDLGDLELVLNLIIGSDVRTQYGTFFLEYMNQDFDNNRIYAGYQFNF
ncbi:MAG: hypothetical protein ABIA59_04665 [Candidatus Latescibacterota bacterium]